MRPIALYATVCTNGRATTMVMATARSMATPARGPGAALRTYLRAFRGVHKQYLHLYVATYEAMVNTKRVTPELIRRMCVGGLSVHSGYT
jgi:transposase-like protein